MYKNLRFLWMLLLMAVFSTGWAEDKESFDLTGEANGWESGTEVPSSIEGSKVTISFDKGANGNAPKYYSTGDAVRCYGGNKLTIAPKEGESIKIKAVAFTRATGSNNNTFSANTGTMTDDTWAGDASTVTFTVSGTTGHIRVSKIEVTYEEEDNTQFNPSFTVTPGLVSLAAPFVDEGTEVTITANGDWTIDYIDPWNDDGGTIAVNAKTYTFNVNDNVHFTIFAKNSAGKLAVRPASWAVKFNPTISPQPGEVEPGTEVTITANAGNSLSYIEFADGTKEEFEEGTVTATVTIDEETTLTIGGINNMATDNGISTVTAAYTVSLGELPEDVLFYETFNQITGSGGNDGQFSGSVGTSDPTGLTDMEWESIPKYGAYQCYRFGTGSATTTFTTTHIPLIGEGTLTFRAAGWGSGTNTLSVSATGGTLTPANTITLANGVWTEYTYNITGAQGSLVLTFTGKRGFIDDIMVVKGSTPVETTEFNPTFSPVPGEVDKNTEVTVTANDEWVFYFYTLNNSQNVFGDETTKTFTVNITEDTELVVCGINTLDPSIENQVVTVNYTVNPESADYETVTLPYEETLVSSQGNFVVEGDACWTFGNYGAVASKKNVTSWLVSPLIDAEDVSEEITLTFEHQGRYFTTPSEEATLWVREAGGEWNQLDITYTDAFTGSKWTTFSEVTVDLSDYAGTTFQIAYKYTSSDSYGGWEVKNVNIVAGEPVVKIDADLSYDVENFTATIGEDNDFPELNNPNDLDVTYRSTNTSVATIDEDGNIELLTAGQTTIIAEFAGNEEYNEGSASYLLVVKEQGIAGTDKYELVTDATTLAADDEIIIVGTADEESFYAMSTTQNTNNRAANAVEIEDDGTIIPRSDIQIFTLEEGELGFAFYTGNGYIYAAASNGNQLKTEPTADDNAYATIDIDDETGEATIVFQGDNTRNHMRFNPNSGNPMFACYAETSSIKNMPRIYRKVTETATTYDVTISKYGLGTFYWSDKAFTLPEGLTAATYTYDEATNKVRPNVVYAAGEAIPADEAVVLKGEASTTYTLTEIAKTASEKDTDNRLLGLDEEGTVEIKTAAFKYYWLGAKEGVPGFYFGAANGAPFTLGAHKAFLALTENEAALATFVMFDGTATAISNIQQTEPSDNGAVYNLNGQKVNKLYKGVIIVNGKKVIRK